MATPTVVNEIESGFSSNVINVRQLDDYLDVLDVDEYPLLKAIGLNSFDQEIYNTKVE